MKRILVLSLLALFGTTAYAAPKVRTTAQWEELCKDAISARDLRTTKLISSKGVAPIRATLAANGLSTIKEEAVPEVLVLHEDGTCGRDNARLFYQITRRPHREANDQFVIGDYADGVAFTDPARRIPEGTMWGAKRTGVEVYLPVQLGECDRDLATCKGAYETVVAERDALRKQLASVGTIATTGNTVAPAPQPTTLVTPPTTPVVAGTVKSVGHSLKARIGFLMIGLAVAGTMLYFLLRDRRRMRKMRAVYHQSHDDMHQTIVRLRAERDEARGSLENTALDRYALDQKVKRRDAEITRLGRYSGELQRLLTSEREAALATKQSHNSQLAEVRGQRDAAEEKLRERSTALEHAVTRANNLADDLRAAQSELIEAQAAYAELSDLRIVHGSAFLALDVLGLTAKRNGTTGETELVKPSDWRSGAEALKATIREMGVQVLSLYQQLEAAHAENHALVDAEVGKGNGHGNTEVIEELRGLLARTQEHGQNTADALRKECNRLRDALCSKQVEIEENLGVAEALVVVSRSKKMREPAREALRRIRRITAQFPVMAPKA